MTHALENTATFLRSGLSQAPAIIDDQGLEAWEQSWAERQKALRLLIGEAIVISGDGGYIGEVGDHWLALGELTVFRDDGYETLIDAWLTVADPMGAA